MYIQKLGDFGALWGGGGVWASKGEMTEARVWMDSIGSHGYWHVESYLHISLWKHSSPRGPGLVTASFPLTVGGVAGRPASKSFPACFYLLLLFFLSRPLSNLFISQDPRLKLFPCPL